MRADYIRPVHQILICSRDTEDKGLRNKFQEEAREAKLTAGIYVSDWITRNVLKQKVAEDEDEDILISS